MLSGRDISVVRRATITAITVVTLLTCLASYVFYRQNVAILAARDWVNHTYEVKGHIQELQSRLRDAVGAARTYIFTNDDSFLVTYYDATRPVDADGPKSDALNPHLSIAEEMTILRRQTADNPDQKRILDQVDQTSKEMIEFLAAAINQHKKGSLTPLLELDPRPTRQYLDHLRELLSVMMNEENDLLALRNHADFKNIKKTNGSIFTCIGIFYISMVLALWLYQRARLISQNELLRYTRQLQESEEALKASHEEIEASNEELEEQNAQIRQHTEELRSSKQLIEQKAKEIEQASRYKTEFLANMSHELRTPLNSLLILSRSLVSNEDGNLTNEQVEDASIIHNDGLELLNLINDILDLSKVEAGKLIFVSEDTQVSSILHRLRQQFVAVAKDKRLEFPVDFEIDLFPSIYTDGHRIEQILKNLLSNAFKFTERGSVSLTAYRPPRDMVQRPSLREGDVIAFSVADTGIGIDASRFKDIFEAFQQEDGSTERNYGGTGLGLTIARKFAHLLGGEIHVVSQKGIGSTFTLLLPTQYLPTRQPLGDSTIDVNIGSGAKQMEAINSNTPTMPRAEIEEFVSDDRRSLISGDRLLLVIEDDRQFALTLMKIARKRGYKCIAAGNGKTGLILASEYPVTAIILDLKLPDINGLLILDLLKKDLKLRHIPVHIITAADIQDQTSPTRKGAIGVLAKPVSLEGIDNAFARIEELLNENVRRILVMEDGKDSQTAIRDLLDHKDIEIVIVGTGATALEHLRTSTFDCLIMDLQLPDIDGFEWLEQAQEKSGINSFPPVIIYTDILLSESQTRRLSPHTNSIIIKGAKSPERLLDEATLFLHSIESSLPREQRDILQMQHNPDKVLRDRTVLLADDDLRNTFALSKFLKKRGLKVVIADNGQMALDKLREDRSIEIVIMDLMMPVMDGYQAMKEMRADPILASLPVIALTARAMPEEQEKCLAAGANDYMTKPVDTERLLTLLRVWLFWQDSQL